MYISICIFPNLEIDVHILYIIVLVTSIFFLLLSCAKREGKKKKERKKEYVFSLSVRSVLAI